MSRILKAMSLAILFVGTGLLTYQIYSWIAKVGTDVSQVYLQFLTALPFAIACSLRFISVRRWIMPALLLDCVTWIVAHRLGLWLAGVNPFLGTAVAGLVGALGVTGATGLGCRMLYSRRILATAAIVGAITGAPFGLVLDRSAQENLILALSFPLWQVGVGLVLWRK